MTYGGEISVSQLPAGVLSFVQSKGVVKDGRVSLDVLRSLLSEIEECSVYDIILKDEAKAVLTNLNNGTLQVLNGNANWGNFDQLEISSRVAEQTSQDLPKDNDKSWGAVLLNVLLGPLSSAITHIKRQPKAYEDSDVRVEQNQKIITVDLSPEVMSKLKQPSGEYMNKVVESRDRFQ